jgi:hypothetical protein
MAKDLIKAAVFENLPAQMGDDDDFKDLSQASDFLRRLQLVSKGKYVDSKQVGPGSYAVIIDGDKAQDLGDKIDILVLARRPKALDMSDVSQVIVSYDKNSDLFQDIAVRSGVKDSGCQYGVSFLIIERSTGCLYEFFCGSKSLRREIPTLSAYMPLSAAQIEARGLKEVEPHGPLPLTMGSKHIKTARYSWFVPDALYGAASAERGSHPQRDGPIHQPTQGRDRGRLDRRQRPS